jgi:hypothetical protein
VPGRPQILFVTAPLFQHQDYKCAPEPCILNPVKTSSAQLGYHRPFSSTKTFLTSRIYNSRMTAFDMMWSWWLRGTYQNLVQEFWVLGAKTPSVVASYPLKKTV